MKMEKKLMIMSVIFTIIISLVAIFTTNIINYSAIPGLIGSDWLTTNNTGVLAVCGIKWWESHTMLIIMQIFTLSVGVCSIYFISWAFIFILEAISILGYLILAQKYEKIEHKFEFFILENMISMYEYNFDYPWLRNVNAFKSFFKILGSHVLFFLITPILIVLWTVKWGAGGVYFAFKWVV